MTYEIYIPPGLVTFLVVYLIWLSLPILLRIKHTMVGERKTKLMWILPALIISAAWLLTAILVRGLALVFYTAHEWCMTLTIKMLGAVINDEKP